MEMKAGLLWISVLAFLTLIPQSVTAQAIQVSANGEDVSNNTVKYVGPGIANVTCSGISLVMLTCSPSLGTTMVCPSGSTVISASNLTDQVDANVNATDSFKDCECGFCVSGILVDTFKISLQLRYGPTTVIHNRTSTQENSTPYCPGEPIDMYCEVDIDDVYPMPNVVLTGFDTGDVQPLYNTNETSTYRYHFNFQIPTPGVHKIKCLASNSLGSSLTAEAETTIHVVQQQYNPELSVSNILASNNSVRYLTLDPVSVSCRVIGNSYDLVGPNLSCSTTGGYMSNNISTNSSVSMQVTLDPSGDSGFCTCLVHMGCSPETITTTLQLGYGPSIIQVNRIEPFELCPNNNETIQASCEIPQVDVYPNASVALQFVGHSGWTEPILNSTTNTTYKFDFSYRPTFTGDVTLKWRASNTLVVPSIVKEITSNVVVLVPPHTPQLKLNRQLIQNGSAVDLLFGDNADVDCSMAFTGTSPYSSSLSCPGVPSTVVSRAKFAIFPVAKELNETICECRLLGCHADAVQFTMHVAFGPTQVTPGRSASAPFDLCPGETTSIAVYCDVDVNDVSPDAVVTVEGEPFGTLQPVNYSIVSGNHRSFFNYRPASGGGVSFTCVAVNKVFSHVRTQGLIFVSVNSPSPNSPVITLGGESVPDGSVQTVQAGQSQTVSCSVEGGHPAVSNVSLRCDGDIKATGQNTMSWTFVPTKDKNGMACTCFADHVSGCYDKETSFTFNVTYPATITSFTANSNSGSVEANSGDTHNMVCQADGNPKPEMSIISTVSGQTLASNIFTETLEYSRTLTCRSSDVLLCKADNRESSDYPLVNLTVQMRNCDLLPVDPSNPAQVATFQPSGVFHVQFNVIAVVDPAAYRLFRDAPPATPVARKRRATGERVEIGRDDYMVRFQRINPVQGILLIDGYDSDMNEGNTYTLVATNNEGVPLSLTFSTQIEPRDPERGSSASETGRSAALIAVSIVSLILLVVIVIVVGCFVKYIIDKPLPKSRKKPRRPVRPKRPAGNLYMYPVHSARVLPDNRLWRSRNGF